MVIHQDHGQLYKILQIDQTSLSPTTCICQEIAVLFLKPSYQAIFYAQLVQLEALRLVLKIGFQAKTNTSSD